MESILPLIKNCFSMKLLVCRCLAVRAWYGMDDDFSIFHTDNFLRFHFHSILKIFHSILKFSSIFHSILPYQRNFRLEAMQRLFCCFASLQCCEQPLVKVRQQYYKMQQPVSGMHTEAYLGGGGMVPWPPLWVARIV